MAIGQLNAATLDGKEELEGFIETLEHDLKFRLKLLHDRRGEKDPSYEIVARNRTSGRAVRIGAGWIKTAARGSHEGEDFISLTFDDPSFPRPLYCTAFPNEDGQTWNIVGSRPRGGDVTG